MRLVGLWLVLQQLSGVVVAVGSEPSRPGTEPSRPAATRRDLYTENGHRALVRFVVLIGRLNICSAHMPHVSLFANTPILWQFL